MHSPKHILFDCERMKFPYTGLYDYCLHLGNALSNAIDKEIELIKFYVPPNAINMFGHSVHYIKQNSAQKFLLPFVDSDVWHCTFQNSMYFPFQKKMPIVFTVHDINFMHDPNIPVRKKKKYLKQLGKKIKRSNHLVFVSNFTLNDVQRFIDVKSLQHTVIYNGANVSAFEKPHPPSLLPEKKFLFTIGTIVDKKNFHVLPRLLASNDLQLIISGVVQSDDYKKKIIEEAKKWKVNDRVIFTGSISQNDKIWYYKHCTAFVFPSLMEGFGLPVIEAMTFGKPVFLSTASSLPEIGSDIAYYFYSFDADEMQNAFQKGMQHYKEHQPQAAIQKRAESFSWDNSATKYIEIYRSLY